MDFQIGRPHDLSRFTIKECLKQAQELWTGGRGKLIRQPFFVPEARTATGLFQDFHDRGNQMAVLLDEYGGTAGLVTMEDLIEELVGEIDDEYDTASENFQVSEVSTAAVSGGKSIRSVNRKLGLNLLVKEDKDIDTIGGYILHLFGRIPEPGEVFSTEDLEFKVAEMDKQRITQVVIKKINTER